MPIRGGGVHVRPEGSTHAIEELTVLLEKDPDELAARWLFNLAHMTLDSYPDAVPDAWLIHPSTFASDVAMAPFPNVAQQAGVAVNGLSGGERQKTAIARALVTRPAYVLADEPTAHQDPENAARVMNLLRECAGRNAVVIIATHATELAAQIDAPVRFHLADGKLETLDA